MTIASTGLKRIVVRAYGVPHDLIVAEDSSVAQVLAALGVRPSEVDRVLGPSGERIELDTRAEALAEGGLYSLARAQSDTRSRRRRTGGAAARGAADWALAALGLVTVMLAYSSDDTWLRYAAAVALGAQALLLALAWALRARREVPILTMLVPFGIGGAAMPLAVPTDAPGASSLAVATGAFAAAVLAAFIGVAGASLRARAAAWAAAAVLASLAGIALLSRPAGWDLAQLGLVLAAVSLVAIRALPSFSLVVEDGYHIDYSRFMVLRWTVRGRVPEYISSVESPEAKQIVEAAEARLESALALLSIIAAVGLPAFLVPLADGDLLERIAASLAMPLVALGLLLVSRRTAAPSLRRMPRIAVVVGLVLAAMLAPTVLGGEQSLGLAGFALLLCGLVTAGVVIPVAAGGRSLAWSRVGDIVEGIAVMLALPSSVLAAGTMDMLRGVLAS